jgi:hypothetical protein
MCSISNNSSVFNNNMIPFYSVFFTSDILCIRFEGFRLTSFYIYGSRKLFAVACCYLISFVHFVFYTDLDLLEKLLVCVPTLSVAFNRDWYNAVVKN